MDHESHLDLRSLLRGNVNRLRYVVRFSTCHRAHDESVAEHSYYVSLYCLLIGKALWMSGFHEFSMSSLLGRALIHDLEEARTGDIPRPFKHSNPLLKDGIDQAGGIAMAQVMRDLLPEADAERYVNTWEHAKDDSFEGRILQFADFLSVLSYLAHEAMSSNRTITEHLDDMQDYMELFHDSKFKFLGRWINEAQQELSDLMRGVK